MARINSSEFDALVNESEDKPIKKDLDNWKETSNKMLRQSGENYRVVNGSLHNFLIIFFVLFVIAILIMSGIFLYMVGDEKFKPSIDQNINSYFNATNENNYNFTSTTKNNVYLNATIVIHNNVNETIIIKNITLK